MTPNTQHPTRVLVLMSDTGGGHRSVAQAIDGGLRRLAGDRVDVTIADVFWQQPVTAVERSTRLYGPMLRYCPGLYGAIFHATNRPHVYRPLAQRLSGRVQGKLERLIRQTDPDVIVSVHPLANRLTLQTLKVLGRATPVVAAVTELVTVHTSWVEDGIALTTTTNETTRAAVLRMGANPSKVRTLGLPVGERFGRIERTPAEIRRELGLDPARFTALLIGGGEGAGSLVPTVKAIDRAGLPAQLAVVCGRNRAVQRALEQMPLQVPAVILGFVKTIPELMHAADVVMTKSGPQTIAEALAAGRPILIVQTMPGQEEGNGPWIEMSGAGYVANNPSRLVELLRRLVGDPAACTAIANRAATLGQPDAADRVAAAILELAARARPTAELAEPAAPSAVRGL